MCAKTTIGVDAAERPQVVFQPLELLVAQKAKSAGLEVGNVDEADEVDAVLVEAVPAAALGVLAVAFEIGFASALIDDVVLAGHIVHVDDPRHR